MSDDKRLGANPLEWVARDPAEPGPDGVPAEIPFPAAPAAPEAARPAQDDNPAPGDAESAPAVGEAECPAFAITIPDTISEEDRMSNGKVKIKQTMDTEQAAAYLEDLAKSLTSGVVRVQSGDDNVVLFAADTMKFEMKLSRKKDKAKCSIEMEWEDDGSNAAGFSISG
ncbi:amphi-Trp domain-containing protein [Pseudodesulfovibrio sp.]|uniref:amphi-Trp domain-containing protein n=1 Tax=Pseudodesulfovibrio sp. TaxID=2035812 RepID=UPI002616031D|nr:amphi-Trp domain-containing protein [Pseudodesulfovibrio sp.]MDD3312140.1 amphi-Trp domain-containing protein [Pseudodesulfovibrio sp.]